MVAEDSGELGETLMGACLWPEEFSISSGLGEVERVEGDGLGLGLCQRTLGKTGSVGKSGKVTVLQSPRRGLVQRQKVVDGTEEKGLRLGTGGRGWGGRGRLRVRGAWQTLVGAWQRQGVWLQHCAEVLL